MQAAQKRPADIAEFLGITDSAVSQWFAKDSGPKSSRLPELARFLNVTVDYLTSDATNEPPPVQKITPIAAAEGRPDIPVWASAEAGKDGAMILVPDPVDYIHRSERMRGVRNPFAFLICGGSMSPALEHGDQVVINPALLPRPGVDCVFTTEQRDGTYLALVKRLQRSTADAWHVSQFSPKRDLTLPRKEWAKAFVIAEIRRGGL